MLFSNALLQARSPNHHHNIAPFIFKVDLPGSIRGREEGREEEEDEQQHAFSLTSHLTEGIPYPLKELAMDKGQERREALLYKLSRRCLRNASGILV